MFAGDGQLISQWGGYLEAAEVPPTMIVGAYRTDDEDEMVRIREYSPSFDEERFAAHEKFFVEDVRRWVRSHWGVALPSERTAVCGVSASEELSLALGLRHPDIYGAVFSASPGGGYRPPAMMPSVLSAHVSGRRHIGAILLRKCDPAGGRATRCGCGRRDDRARRGPWRPVLASRVAGHGCVGIWTLAGSHWRARLGPTSGVLGQPHHAAAPLIKCMT